MTPLELELTELGQKMKVRADVLGFAMTWRVVAGTGWQAWKIEVVGPTRRAAMDERFKGETQTLRFSARQARAAIRSHGAASFMGWAVK